MKSIFASLTIAATMAFTAPAFAADKTPGEEVKQAFMREFKQATNAEWKALGDQGIFSVRFTLNNEPIQAFYAADGEFLGANRRISKSQLPIMVLTALDKQYNNAHIATIFEYSRSGGLDYYITMATEKGGFILKAEPNGELSVYKKNVQ